MMFHDAARVYNIFHRKKGALPFLGTANRADKGMERRGVQGFRKRRPNINKNCNILVGPHFPRVKKVSSAKLHRSLICSISMKCDRLQINVKV